MISSPLEIVRIKVEYTEAGFPELSVDNWMILSNAACYLNTIRSGKPALPTPASPCVSYSPSSLPASMGPSSRCSRNSFAQTHYLLFPKYVCPSPGCHRDQEGFLEFFCIMNFCSTPVKCFFSWKPSLHPIDKTEHSCELLQ